MPKQQRASTVSRRGRPFPPPLRWTVASGVLARVPWDLSGDVLHAAFGTIWDGQPWHAVQRTDDTLTVEAD